MKSKKSGEPKVYVPDNARLNIDNKKDEPPKTKYEKTRRALKREQVNKLVGGKYGSEQSS
jgi:hypothetical protein